MNRPSRRMLSILLFFPFVLLLIGFLLFREQGIKRPDQVAVTTAGYVEMCLSCHTKEKLDPAHDPLVIGCSPCHLGDALAVEKEAAHKGMVMNPGDLRVVEKTCGIEGCHPADVIKVKNSLMATNRGILATLLYYWGEREQQDAEITVEQLLQSGETSLALDYYRKLCATCHLWKQKNDLPEAPAFFNEKGGGCTACHFVAQQGSELSTVTEFMGADSRNRPHKETPHPFIVKTVPDDNCIRCHNRSGRIGLSYIGLFEAEGYGTPYEKGRTNSRKLPGDRFYLEIADDVHHARNMSCIDCHTREEIMGDGRQYAHYEEQLEITCTTCHSDTPGITSKGNRLTNVIREGNHFYLVGKNSDEKKKLLPPKKEACGYPGHKRLGCESCHSTWVPQCFGCHAKLDKRQTLLDKLTLKESKGWWEEGRSYIRYEKPMLAVWGDQVVTVTPGCQDIVTIIDEQGHLEQSFNRFTMAAINPHTIQAKGRTCKDCHCSTKTVGLGEGTVYKKDGQWHFQAVDQGVDTPSGRTVGLDNFVDINGTPLQHGSRDELRPFNKEELHGILRVGLCLECHDSYTDPAFQDYSIDSKCPVYSEP